MFVFIFLALFWLAQSTCITQDQGFNEEFNLYKYSDFLCDSGKLFEQTIQFKQEFCAPPKILMQSIFYYLHDSPSFSFKILTSSTTEFQVQLRCDSLQHVTFYNFEWVALIDDEILVFNDFMQSITLIDGYRTNIIPYPKQNTDYGISFSITSFSTGIPNIIIEKQANGFNLYVTGVDSTQISGLGVQIIAGEKSVYFLFDSMTLYCPVYTDFIKIPPGFEFLPNQIRIIVQQTFNDEIFSIGTQTFLDRIIYYRNNVCRPDLSVNFALYIYQIKYMPHYYKKIRVSQKMCLDYILIGSFDTQLLYFNEINQTWIDNNLILPPIKYKQENISLVYYHQCQPKRKIIVTILREGKEGVYNYTYNLYCHRLYNLITIYIHLLQGRVGSSELQLSLSDYGVQIHQIMMDTGDTYQLLNIQY